MSKSSVTMSPYLINSIVGNTDIMTSTPSAGNVPDALSILVDISEADNALVDNTELTAVTES